MLKNFNYQNLIKVICGVCAVIGLISSLSGPININVKTDKVEVQTPPVSKSVIEDVVRKPVVVSPEKSNSLKIDMRHDND